MDATNRTYTIREVAAMTGLPASTLRYYESIGVTPKVGRGETSGHRVYSQDDLDLASWVACLAATGMPIEQMREYVTNGSFGADRAANQVALLAAQDDRLAREERRLATRRRYVHLKIEFWQALADGDTVRADELAEQAANLGEAIHHDLRTAHQPTNPHLA